MYKTANDVRYMCSEETIPFFISLITSSTMGSQRKKAFRTEKRCDLAGLVDAFTTSALNSDEQIYRCRTCGVYYHESSVTELIASNEGRCVNCSQSVLEPIHVLGENTNSWRDIGLPAASPPSSNPGTRPSSVRNLLPVALFVCFATLLAILAFIDWPPRTITGGSTPIVRQERGYIRFKHQPPGTEYSLFSKSKNEYVSSGRVPVPTAPALAAEPGEYDLVLKNGEMSESILLRVQSGQTADVPISIHLAGVLSISCEGNRTPARFELLRNGNIERSGELPATIAGLRPGEIEVVATASTDEIRRKVLLTEEQPSRISLVFDYLTVRFNSSPVGARVVLRRHGKQVAAGETPFTTDNVLRSEKYEILTSYKTVSHTEEMVFYRASDPVEIDLPFGLLELDPVVPGITATLRSTDGTTFALEAANNELVEGVYSLATLGNGIRNSYTVKIERHKTTRINVVENTGTVRISANVAGRAQLERLGVHDGFTLELELPTTIDWLPYGTYRISSGETVATFSVVGAERDVAVVFQRDLTRVVSAISPHSTGRVVTRNFLYSRDKIWNIAENAIRQLSTTKSLHSSSSKDGWLISDPFRPRSLFGRLFGSGGRKPYCRYFVLITDMDDAGIEVQVVTEPYLASFSEVDSNYSKKLSFSFLDTVTKALK